VYSIYDLRSLPRKELPNRFGAQLLSQLDQLVGSAEEPLMLAHPRQHTVAHREFDPPLCIQRSIHQAILALTANVLEQLQSRQKQASRFTLIIQGIDPRQSVKQASFLIRKEFSLHAATRDLSHISSVIQPFLDALKIPEGVMQISLCAQGISTRKAEQEDYESKTPGNASQQQCDEFLNNTILQLGRGNVTQVALHESHIPENSYSFVPVDQTSENLVNSRHKNLRYPSCILKHPQRISALSLLPDAPPTRITWQGKRLDIVKGEGPERIAEEWWRNKLGSGCSEREYFRVQDQTGRWLWVFRDRESMDWYLHGIWG
jgi:protein ImuB